MKKLLTLCLALAMTVSVGAIALTAFGAPVAKAADETTTEKPETLTVKEPVTIDYANSTPLEQDKFSRIQIWIDHGLRNRRSNVSGNLRTAIRFVTPLPVESVDYFDFKALIWGGRREGLPFNVYSLNGDKIHQSVYVFNYASTSDPETYEGQLDMRVAAKGLENENGLVEGFEFEILNIIEGSHLVFSDITAAKEHSQSVVVDEQHSTSSNVFQLNRKRSVFVFKTFRRYAHMENGTLTVKLKYPVDVAKVKTVDFDAIVWNNPSEKHLRISKLDGTPVEVIKVVCGHEAALAEEDLGVKVNAELLANEFGLCEGFIMQVVEDNALGHLQFTKPVAGLTQKSYKATITFGDGTKEEIVYTASDRTAKLAEAKAKLGTNDAQYTFSDDLPEELPFEEGKAYTETRTVNEYDVVIGEAEAVKVAYGKTLTKPEDPTKEPTADTVYTFDGWYNGDNKWNFETDTVAGNVTLVAKFNETVRKYDVVIGEAAAVKVAYGAKLEKPEDPTKETTASTIYAFDGWYNGDSKWNFETDTVTGDVTLVAKFNETARTYTVTVTFAGLEKEQVTLTREYGAKVNFDEYAESGYKMTAKKGEEAITELTVNENSDIVITYEKEKSKSGKGCGGSAGGIGVAMAALGLVAVALKKKR